MFISGVYSVPLIYVSVAKGNRTNEQRKQNKTKNLIDTENRLVVIRGPGAVGWTKGWELDFCGGHFAVYTNIE